jgi:signal transduction histidine kinase
MEMEPLKRVLCNEIFPSLLIREAALVRLDDTLTPYPVFSLGVRGSQLPQAGDIQSLLAEHGGVRQPYSKGSSSLLCPWARLILPLALEGKPIGLCLLGRRDPDDIYAPTEIPILQALMNQTALALINIEQAGHLLALYQADIERQEVERNQLALELHDDVLGQMALLAMSVEATSASPQFEQAYQSATGHIRQIVAGLRPTMLNYGLRPALDELVDETATLGAGTTARLEVPASDVRYPAPIELSLFRIVQQACQNALQHAGAKTICISGILKPEEVDLVVVDDGHGFASGETLDLAALLAHKHFGLAGMYERAASIDARMTIESASGRGTRVHVIWHSSLVPA